MILSSKYSQLYSLSQTLLSGTETVTSALLDQLALSLQTVTELPSSSVGIGIISPIFSSVTLSSSNTSSLSSATATAAPYSWLIDGILPGTFSESSSSGYCLWVQRGLSVGKSLVSIVEMEEEVKRLKEEKRALQTREELLSVEKKALSKRLEDNERMLEKYAREKRESRQEEEQQQQKEKGGKKSAEEEIQELKKENKVCPSSPPLELFCLSLCPVP
jgi:hypothetical protein